MEKITFISEGKINVTTGENTRILNCQTADKYREREREIRLKNEWKSKGMGAMFTGSYSGDAPLDIRLPIAGLARGIDERLVYSINFESGGGIYFKHLDDGELETPILVSTKMSFFELDVNAAGRIAVSTGENYLERHITLLKVDDSYSQGITEGESADCNPRWSLRDENMLYYDSAGIGYDGSGHFAGFGPRGVFRLDIKTGELDEVLVGGKYDYYCPFEDEHGNLYYIRRPYKQNSGGMSAADYAAAPGKILRAFGGWLDFFTRRYSGESLKTSGTNPAKGNPKSPEQIFIDGNLIEAEKLLKQNAAAGDKNPGYAPQDWELMVNKRGVEQVLHKSVMGYCVTNGGIVYSNGKYIISGDKAVKAHLASKIVLI